MPDFRNPKFVIYLLSIVLSTLVALGVLSPSVVAGIQEPLTRIIEALVILATNVAIVYAAFKTPPTKVPTPAKPKEDGQPTLFD